MKSFFSRNIDRKGRLVRGLGALLLLIGAVFGFNVSVWLGIVLLATGAFVAFEALRGWCVMRACASASSLVSMKLLKPFNRHSLRFSVATGCRPAWSWTTVRRGAIRSINP